MTGISSENDMLFKRTGGWCEPVKAIFLRSSPISRARKGKPVSRRYRFRVQKGSSLLNSGGNTGNLNPALKSESFSGLNFLYGGKFL